MFQYDHIKYRNMVVQVVLYVITAGIYGIYWFYATLKELHLANYTDARAGWWTVLLLVPIANIFAFWHHAHQYAQFIGEKYPGIGIFLLWLVFAPAAWFLVQRDLNRAASYYQN